MTSFKINKVTNPNWTGSSPLSIDLNDTFGYVSVNLLGPGSKVETSDCTSEDCASNTCSVCLTSSLTDPKLHYSENMPTQLTFNLANEIPSFESNTQYHKPIFMILVDNLLSEEKILVPNNIETFEVKNGNIILNIPTSNISFGRIILAVSGSYSLQNMPLKIKDQNNNIINFPENNLIFNPYNQYTDSGQSWGVPVVDSTDTTKWSNELQLYKANLGGSVAMQMKNNSYNSPVFFVSNSSLFNKQDSIPKKYNDFAIYGGGLTAQNAEYGSHVITSAKVKPTTSYEWNISNNSNMLNNYKPYTKFLNTGTSTKFGNPLDMEMSVPNNEIFNDIILTTIFTYNDGGTIKTWQYFGGTGANYGEKTRGSVSSSNDKITLTFDNAVASLPTGITTSMIQNIYACQISSVLVEYKFNGPTNPSTTEVFRIYYRDNYYAQFINTTQDWSIGFYSHDQASKTSNSAKNNGRWSLYHKERKNPNNVWSTDDYTQSAVETSNTSYSCLVPYNEIIDTAGNKISNVSWPNNSVTIYQVGKCDVRSIIK
jgi:hypothetical protein